MLSKAAIKMPSSQMNTVKRMAISGSPRFVVFCKGANKGMTPSLAMACKSRGAPEKRDIVKMSPASLRI
uniref:Uncharacterized protein n=1 Tax=Romanomermis culicivorax TaxID=13658 RepID=A0A915JRI4_ROMCU